MQIFILMKVSLPMLLSYLPTIFNFTLLNLYAVVYTRNKEHYNFRYSFPKSSYKFLKFKNTKDKIKKFKYYFDIFHNIIFYGGYKYLPTLLKDNSFFPYKSFYVKIYNKDKSLQTDEFPMFLVFYSFFLHHEFLKKQKELKEIHKKEHISKENKTSDVIQKEINKEKDNTDTIEKENKTSDDSKNEINKEKDNKDSIEKENEDSVDSKNEINKEKDNTDSTEKENEDSVDSKNEINKEKDDKGFDECDICNKNSKVWEFSINIEDIQSFQKGKVQIPEISTKIGEIKDQLNKIFHEILKTKISAIIEAAKTIPKEERNDKSEEQLGYQLGVTLPVIKEIKKIEEFKENPELESVSSESESEEWSVLSVLCLKTQEKKKKETYLELNLDVERIDIFFTIIAKFLFDRNVMRNLLNDRVIDKRFFKGLNQLVWDLFYWRASKLVILFGWNFYLNPHWKPYWYVKKSYGARRSISGLVFDIYDFNCILRQLGIEIDYNLFSHYTSLFLDTRLIDNKLVKLNKTLEEAKIHDLKDSALFCESLAEICYRLLQIYFWDNSFTLMTNFTVSTIGYGDDSLIFINRLINLIKPGNKLYYSGWSTDKFVEELNRMWKKVKDMTEEKETKN